MDALRVAALAAVVLGHRLVAAPVPGAAGLPLFCAAVRRGPPGGRRPWSSTWQALALLLAARVGAFLLRHPLVVPGHHVGGRLLFGGRPPMAL